MSKNFPTTEACVKAWAAGQHEDGQCGNVSFDRGALYSYRACIGHLHPNRVAVVSTRRWSSTTNRHQSRAHSAARAAGLTVIRAYDPVSLAESFAAAVDEVEAQVLKAATARQHGLVYVDRAQHLAHEFNRFAQIRGDAMRVVIPKLTEERLSAIKVALAHARRMAHPRTLADHAEVALMHDTDHSSEVRSLVWGGTPPT